MKKHIRLNVIKVKYEDAQECLTQIIEAKEDYHEIVSKNLMEKLDETYAKDLLNSLGINDFSLKTVHTVVLFDDAIEVFKNKRSKLYRMLFENRQPKITYFLCIQDPVGIDASLKANLDTLWLFGMFNKQKFNYIFQQISSPLDKNVVWDRYKELTMNQALIFDYTRTGSEVFELID